MAIIYSFPRLSNLAGDDLLLVTDSSAQGKPTKNITVQQIVDLIPNIVPGGGTVTSIELDFQTTGLSLAAGTSQTITTSGTFAVQGTLNQGFGGTGFNTYNNGSLIYADNSGTLVQLAPGSSGEVLQIDNTTTLPVWGSAGGQGTVTAIGMASGLSGITWAVGAGEQNPTNTAATFTLNGTLGFANGGTGATSQQGALDAVTNANSGTANQVLTTDGANASWQTFTTGVTTFNAGATGFTPNTNAGGAITLGGTLVPSAGGTGINSWTANEQGRILWYDNATPASLQTLAIGSAGQVLTVNSGANAPEWSTPNSQTIATDTTVGVSAQIQLVNSSSGTTDFITLDSNDTSVNNQDLNIKGSTVNEQINVFHKDLLASSEGPGTYISPTSIVVSSSGHITNITSQKFTAGGRPQGISLPLAGFKGDSGAEVIAMPMFSPSDGQFGAVEFQLDTSGTGGDEITVAYYKGELDSGIGAGNPLVAYGSIAVANLVTPVSRKVEIGSYQVAPNNEFKKDTNYIMVVVIPAQPRLRSISQDGDLVQGGCQLTGFALSTGVPPATLSGVTTVARVAGTPIKLPANQWAPSATS